MEITGKITKEGQIAGVRIQDGDKTFCIQLNILTWKLIFEGLIESGYKYASYPYGFVKDGKSIEDLEEVPYDTLSEIDQQEFTILPGTSEYMTEAELKMALPKENACVEKPAKVNNPIATRHEFLTFLMSLPGSAQNPDNPESFLPLNYLVSDEALFTHVEYFSKRNEKYRELIERREKLSFECYRHLIDWMMEAQVISPDFSALDFKRAYYSWGVPGIKTQFLCMSVRDSGLKVMHSTIENKEKNTINVHYFGRDGKVNPPLMAGQHLLASTDWIEDQRQFLAENEIQLITSCSPVIQKVLTVECDGFTLEYDEHTRRIQPNDGNVEYVSPILQIRASGGGTLENRYFNTVRRESQTAYWKDRVFSACVEHLVQKTAVETDKSSFRAIQEGLSLSPAATIKYIIACLALRINHRVDIEQNAPIDGIDEETGELMNIYQAAYQFLPNMLSVTPEDFDINIFAETFGADPFQVADIIDTIISGDQNIDDIESGYIADRSISHTVIRQAIEFAESKLGYSVDEIIEAVTEFDPYVNNCLSFEKEGIGRINIPIPVRNHQEVNYPGEVMYYKALSASTALGWYYVLTAITEPGRNEGRHCAARVLTWTHRTSTDAMQTSQPRIEEALRSLVCGSIGTIEDAGDRDTAMRCVDIVVANMLFDVRLSGKKDFTLPELYGGMAVSVPENIVFEISKSKNFIEKLESTYGLSDHAADGSEIFYHFVNARITPHYIIPNKGRTIPEVAFMPLWKGRDEYGDYWERYHDICTTLNFQGYSGIYYTMSAALPTQNGPMDEGPSLLSPYSLRVYYRKLMAYLDEASEKKEHHILTPPSLAEHDQPYLYKMRPDISCDASGFHARWINSPPRALTRELAGERNGVGGNLLEEFRACVSWVNGFALEDYMLLTQDVSYDIFSACGDRIKAVQYLGDKVRFLDGYTHNFRDALIDDTKYAVFKTLGGTYIPFINGKIAKTDTKAFGG